MSELFDGKDKTDPTRDLHRDARAAELDRLLESWKVGAPSSDLRRRLLAEYRIRRRSPSRGPLGGSIRVPVWLAAACVALILLLIPAALRGLTTASPGPDAEPVRETTTPATERPTDLGSMVSRAASAESYITVADLSRLRPTEDINLRIIRVEEKEP